jgi:hypothetical protein
MSASETPGVAAILYSAFIRYLFAQATLCHAEQVRLPFTSTGATAPIEAQGKFLAAIKISPALEKVGWLLGDTLKKLTSETGRNPLKKKW